MNNTLPPPPDTAPSASPSPAPTASPATNEVRSWGLFAHLSAYVAFLGVPSFVGPLVVWLIRRERDPFSAEHAREALNFNLSVLLYVAVAVVASIATLGLGLVVVIPAAVVAVPAWMILTVVAAVRASDGRPYEYPLTIEFVR